MKRLVIWVVLGSLLAICPACKVEEEPEIFGLEAKFEVFALSIGDAAEIAREKSRYEAVLKKVESGQGKLEKVMMVSGSGFRLELKEVKEYGKGISAVEIPIFEVASFEVELSMILGTTVHVGTVPAPGDGDKGKVWMGFITVESIKK